MTITQSIGRPVTILVLLLALLLGTMSVVFAEAVPKWNTIYGEVDIPEGGKLSRVTIIDETSDTVQEGYSPAIDTHGTADIRRVVIENSGVGVRASSGVGRTNFQFHENTIRGLGNSIGLILGVPVNSPSQIIGNVFENQSCGINVSIDVVFGSLPFEERVAAFADFAEKLQEANTFVDVGQSICGARG